MRSVRIGLVLLTLAACKAKAAPPAPPPPEATSNTTVAAAVIAPAAPPSDLPPPTPELPTPPSPPALTGKKVLVAGDSMVGGNFGLAAALEPKFKAEGAKLVHFTKVSETVASFDKHMTELLAYHDPDILFITLGSNDVTVPFPQAYLPNIQSIAKKVGKRECWWIGPPTWKPDSGIVALIRDNAAPCKFFDSSNLKLERTTDGIHPTTVGAGQWADKLWVAFRSPET